MPHVIPFSHFVPLCRTLDSSAPKIPMNCQPAFYRCSKIIGRQYIDYNTDGSFSIGLPVLFSDVHSTHLFKTMGYRFKPHKPEQPGFFHGLIDRLIESSFQELSTAFSEKGCCSYNLLFNLDDQHEELRMTATNILMKVLISFFNTWTILPSWCIYKKSRKFAFRTLMPSLLFSAYSFPLFT